MLYQIGTISLDTRPFNADEVDRDATADFAVKPLLGSLPGREFMGEGDDEITISGQLLPSKIGGLTQLEALHAFRQAGQRMPVMRGDGKMMGWFVITRIREQHADLLRDGVGFTVDHSITLAKTSSDGASPSIIGALLSIFGAVGR